MIQEEDVFEPTVNKICLVFSPDLATTYRDFVKGMSASVDKNAIADNTGFPESANDFSEFNNELIDTNEDMGDKEIVELFVKHHVRFSDWVGRQRNGILLVSDSTIRPPFSIAHFQHVVLIRQNGHEGYVASFEKNSIGPRAEIVCENLTDLAKTVYKLIRH